MNRPAGQMGMRHVALFVNEFEKCENFYVNLLGMKVEWRPDADNVYLTSGNDNVALHRAVNPPGNQFQKLDHIGFIIQTPELVDQWFEFLKANDVKMRNEPKTHRDGARSFYCFDPDGIVVQIIYHPPLCSNPEYESF